jgi:hypothetical protein
MTGLASTEPSSSRIPAAQQTRIAAFLISAHGFLARHLSLSLPARFDAAWHTELHAHAFREAEIVSLLMRTTEWLPDMLLPWLTLTWEVAWQAPLPEGFPDAEIARLMDLAAFGHALHGAIRPATVFPDSPLTEPFVVALRRIEFESGRLIQAQMLVLKDQRFLSQRTLIVSAVERRHAQIQALWTEMLKSLGLTERQQ